MSYTSINVIQLFPKRFSGIYFSHDDKYTVLKEIKILIAKKAIEGIRNPVIVLKKNANFFSKKICLQSNELSVLPNFKQLPHLISVTLDFKKG